MHVCIYTNVYTYVFIYIIIQYIQNNNSNNNKDEVKKGKRIWFYIVFPIYATKLVLIDLIY